MQRSLPSRSAATRPAPQLGPETQQPTVHGPNGATTASLGHPRRQRRAPLAAALTAGLVAILILAACGGPTTQGHDHDRVHASCFALVTGHGSALDLSSLSTAQTENPSPSPAPPTPTRSWSDAAGWPGGKLPAEGDDVVIQPGEVVLLDTSTPALGSLSVDGALVFDRRDLELTAANIEVRGGLYVGSWAEPFRQRAVIIVGAEELGPESDCFGHNYIGLVHGVLELYGDDTGPAWTRLAAHAQAGDTSIVVDDASGWQRGDRVAIASTDFYSNTSGEAMDRRIEVRTLTDVSGNTLSFDEPLRYARFGEAQRFGSAAFPTTVLESRAEVMRLTRNVTVRGLPATADEASPVHRYGAHIKALGQSRVRLDSVEVTAMGQSGVLMRYPVHFHLQGDSAQGSFVRNSSLHHLYNRCITIHGSSGVLLEGNAAFNTYGHCYFLEDGAETRNVLKRNFGMMAREPAPEYRILPTDGGHMGPSIFWITNPDNVLVDNVAAHSAGSGFWYSLPEHPTGPSYDVFDGANVWPRRTPLGRFDGNLAHSNQNDGLHVDRGPAAVTLRAETASYRPRRNPADPNSEPVVALFENFVAYKHRSAAAWFRGDHTELTGALLVDNAVGATFASRDSGLVNSVVVARSANAGTAEPWEATEEGRPIPRPWSPTFAPRGFEFYDGTVYLKDSYFEGFEPYGERRAGAISMLDYTSFSLSPLSYAQGLTFAPGTVRVMFADLSLEDRQRRAEGEDSGNDGYASGLFLDLDGSVTGTPDHAVTVNNPLLQLPGCTYNSEWNASVCEQRYASLTLRNTSGRNVELAPVVLSRGAVDGSPEHTMFGTPHGGVDVPNVHFRALVPLGHEYHYRHEGYTPGALTLELGSARPGDSMVVSLPFSSQAPSIYRDWWIDERNRLPAFGSLSQLRNGDDTGYFLDPGGRLYLNLVVQPDRDYAHLTVCATALCR